MEYKAMNVIGGSTDGPDDLRQTPGVRMGDWIPGTHQQYRGNRHIAGTARHAEDALFKTDFRTVCTTMS
jgi:hypothetical protein